MKKLISVFLVVVMLFTLTGCSNNKQSAGDAAIDAKISEKNAKREEENKNKVQTDESKIPEDSIDFAKAAEEQLLGPEKGETIAIMKIKGYEGEMKFKFFEDKAPKAVKNFIEHAKAGYYNGITFHRVINEFMIQGGDPTGTGMGGESIYGEGFEEEFDDTLVPYRGSLCMASAGVGRKSLGSQFFITQAHYNPQMEALYKQTTPKGLMEQYKLYGGYLSLYKQYTVFGQLYDGFAILDEIAQVPTTTTKEGQADKPVEDVIIESVTIQQY